MEYTIVETKNYNKTQKAYQVVFYHNNKVVDVGNYFSKFKDAKHYITYLQDIDNRVVNGIPTDVPCPSNNYLRD